MAFSFSFFLPLCIELSHCAAPNNVSHTNQMSRHVSHLMQRTLCVCGVCVLKGMPPAKESRRVHTLHVHTPDIFWQYFAIITLLQHSICFGVGHMSFLSSKVTLCHSVF